jgi:cytochrome c553
MGGYGAMLTDDSYKTLKAHYAALRETVSL